MGPESRLWERIRDTSGFLKDPNESGIGPVSLFLSKRRDTRLGIRESELGIEPERLLNERSKNSRFLSWAKKSGTGPVRLFQLRYNSLRLVSFAMVG